MHFTSITVLFQSVACMTIGRCKQRGAAHSLAKPRILAKIRQLRPRRTGPGLNSARLCRGKLEARKSLLQASFMSARNTLWTQSFFICSLRSTTAGGTIVFIRLIAVLISISLSSALASANSNGTQGGSVGAKKELPRTPRQSPAGVAQIYLYWPRDGLGWLNSLLPDMEIYVDDKKIGTMLSGNYITTQVPIGNHVIAFRAGILSLPMTRNNISIAEANTKYYYRIIKTYINGDPKAVRLVIEKASEARALQELKELHKR